MHNFLINKRLFLQLMGSIMVSSKKYLSVVLTNNKHLAVRVADWPTDGFPREAESWPEDPRQEVTLGPQQAKECNHFSRDDDNIIYHLRKGMNLNPKLTCMICCQFYS